MEDEVWGITWVIVKGWLLARDTVPPGTKKKATFPGNLLFSCHPL
jgi:hypothetical protein